MKDSFYTPTFLAKLLINYIDKQNINTVADFCVGDGELLRAASNKWEKIECFGSDISKKAINATKKRHPNWVLHKCDFLNEKSRSHCSALKSKSDGFDLILMNPPFSCLGGTRYDISVDGKSFKVSTAMAFLLNSIDYIADNGSLYAIMPNSIAYSEKDKEAWEALIKKYHLEILNETNERFFEECSPNVILISLKKGKSTNNTREPLTLNVDSDNISIFRGKVGMHSINGSAENGHYLVHSTNLRNNQLTNLDYKINSRSSEIRGPAVLLPRVGIPNKGKVCVLDKSETVVLSDCILAIKTETNKESIVLMSTLLDNWEAILGLYKGTGAKYTTIKRVATLLNISSPS